MPRGDGRWSRAGQSTGRRRVLWSARLGLSEHEIIERVDREAMKKTFSYKALEPDMQKLVKRAEKLGARVAPTRHGGCRLYLPDDEGQPIYVPKSPGPGTVTDLNDALDRYERGERAGMVMADNTADPDEETPDMADNAFDPELFLAHYYELVGERDRLQGELDSANERIDHLQADNDRLSADLAEARTHTLSDEDKALLEAARAFGALMGRKTDA